MRLFISIAILCYSVQRLTCADGGLSPRLTFFDIDLLRYTAENKQGNVLVSPASIKSILAMLLEGAVGPTADEIKAALRLSTAKEDYWKELTAYLETLQANSTGTTLQNSNMLFLNDQLNLVKEYERYINIVYQSDVVKVNFGSSNVVDDINRWVQKRTMGLIPSIVESGSVNLLTKMLATNAIYFKGFWQNAFNPKLTHEACFTSQKVCTNVAMMELRAILNYAYVENLRAHALELPYLGNRYSMILLIPRDHDSSEELIRDLPHVGLPVIYGLMQQEQVQLSMPKFTIDYTVDMVEALKSMRIKTLFTPAANLSVMFEGGSSYVSNLVHRVHLSVDEEGTVAAAASSAMVVPLINDSVQVKADRPFLFFIRDNLYGFVIFEGKIEEPSEVANQFDVRKNSPAPDRKQ